MFDWLFGRKREQEPVEPERVAPVGVEAPDSQMPPIDVERLESQLDALHREIGRLVERAEALQEQMERLDHRAAFGNDQLETLVQHLTDVADWTGPLDRRLAELVTWAEQSREALAQLEEGLRKLGRTQFKANSLAEAQQERLQSALEMLRKLATQKQEEAERARQRQRAAVEAAQREARVAMAVDLFPALDGLESALESGRRILERSRRSIPRPGFLTRLAYAFGLRELPGGGEDNQALVAWLDGLELVRERFLALLQAEGIQPIRAVGKPFDPHRHVAVEAVERSDLPPGTVVEERRPGYRLGDRVLRYAEVVVTRDSAAARQPTGTPEAPTAIPGEAVRQPEEPVVEAAAGPAQVEPEVGEPGMEEPPEEEPASEQLPEPTEEPAPVREHPWVEGPVEAQEAEEPAPGESTAEDNTRTEGAEGGEQELDPQIQEILARFEARQRARREGQ